MIFERVEDGGGDVVDGFVVFDEEDGFGVGVGFVVEVEIEVECG